MNRLNYMKLIVFCTLLAARSVCAADNAPSALLRCLAQEEAGLHKQKRSGPQYKLNQLFFNEWSGNPSLELTNQAYQKICGSSANSASIHLLREFMLKGKKIFRSYKSDPNDSMATMRKITLEELRRQMPQVFFTYVADLEVFAPTANCLEESIPALAKLRQQYRYLETEISWEFMDSYQREWSQAFDGLEHWPKHFANCQKRLAKKTKQSGVAN